MSEEDQKNYEAQLGYIFSSKAVRERANVIFERTKDGEGYFKWNENKLNDTATFVLEVIKENYPSLEIPFHSRWGHFNAGNVNRVDKFKETLSDDAPEKCRSMIDLVFTSVLLDAGAGASWSYKEPSTNQEISRSEGLAVASLDLFMSGAFSSQSSSPLQADSDGLKAFNKEALEKGFQVSSTNPLVGVEGRVTLLNSLGEVISQNPTIFPDKRIGNFYDYISKEFGTTLEASDLLAEVLKLFSAIWPGRLELNGVNLGDVWIHSNLDLHIPFHKLSQWLTYSLMEPLMEAGIQIENLDSMTGLPEYRNGGLILDTGLIELKDSSLSDIAHRPESDLIIEWRALTVKSLDLIAEKLREMLEMSGEDLPLVKVLEGGTWHAGRKIAKEKREGGRPPLNIESDGTVF